MIDPSKANNFFYDEKNGFSFVDLNFASKKELEKSDIANYIVLQFRNQLSNFWDEVDTNLKKKYIENISTLYKHIKEGFLLAGLKKSECKKCVITEEKSVAKCKHEMSQGTSI